MELNFESPIPCVGCPCFVMPESLVHRKSGKCSECTRRNVACEASSWRAIDAARSSARDSIKDVEAERSRLLRRLAELQATLDRHQCTLGLAQERARRKTSCLVRELEEDGEDLSRTVVDAALTESELVNFDFSPSQLDRALGITNET